MIVAGFLAASTLIVSAQTPQQAPAPPAVAPPRATTPQPAARPPLTPTARAGAAVPVTPAQASAATTQAQATSGVAPAIASMSSWQNVNLEFTITDTFGKTPSKKTVTMLVADRGTGRVRSSMQIQVQMTPGPPGSIPASYSSRPISMNIDATVTLPSTGRLAELTGRLAELQQRTVGATSGRPGQIMLNLTVQYTPDMSVQGSAPTPATLDESLNVVVQDGVPTLISQSADPQGDRKVMLEVKATIVK
jgi:hypothetical protein